MRRTKEALAGGAVRVGREDMERINALSRKTLTPEEVYTFSVRLCDNEVDRDGERFSAATLEQLKELFVGKSGIFDHSWSAKHQAARIYRTQVVTEAGQTTAAGDGLCYLKGFAYMLRTEGNKELIDAIEGGIQKEVSVGCAVARSVCSICGQEIGSCGHQKGEVYGGKLCFAELTDATDAYEWSFVAVPAQRAAGVMKQFGTGGDEMELKQFLEDKPTYKAQFETLEREALAGRRYLEQLRGEVVRLAGLVQPELSGDVVRRIVEKLDEDELKEMSRVYAKSAQEAFPAGPQLTYLTKQSDKSGIDGAFLV